MVIALTGSVGAVYTSIFVTKIDKVRDQLSHRVFPLQIHPCPHQTYPMVGGAHSSIQGIFESLLWQVNCIVEGERGWVSLPRSLRHKQEGLLFAAVGYSRKTNHTLLPYRRYKSPVTLNLNCRREKTRHGYAIDLDGSKSHLFERKTLFLLSSV